MITNPRRTSRTVAILCVLGNTMAIGINLLVAIAGGVWFNLALVPVGIFGIAVTIRAWRKYGRWLPTHPTPPPDDADTPTPNFR